MQRSDWEYTKPKGFSIVTQFDLRCDQQWIINLIRSVAFIGWGLGAIIIGYLGDKYGRKKLLLPSICGTLLISLVTPFVPNIYVIVAFRVFGCFFLTGATLQSYILISEVVDEKRRALAGTLIYMTIPLSFCFLTLKASLITEWKYLCVACSIPYILVLIFYNFIPESIEWLRANGRTDEVKVIVERIASWNNTVLSSNVKVAPPTNNLNGHTSGILDIFCTRKLAVISFVSGYIWLTVALGYYGLFLAADDLGGNLYIDFFVMSITEIPTVFVSVYFSDKLGRKKGSLSTLLAGALLLLGVAPLPTKGTLLIVRICFGMIGKFMLSVTFNCIYLWSMEMYPTNVRAKGMGWLQITARIGSALAPWVSEWLTPFGKGAPFIAMGIPSLVGLGLGFILPETQTKSTDVKKCTVVSNVELTEKYESMSQI